MNTSELRSRTAQVRT